MAKKMLIDATHAEETRVVVVDGNKVEEFDFESLNRRQLAGNIYLAKVTRVEPSLQAAFVDYGGNRHGFLAFSEIHPDYYQIPTADREALLAEEAEYNRAMADDDGDGAEETPDVEEEKPAEVEAEAAAEDEKPDAAQAEQVTDVTALGAVVEVDEGQSDLVDVPESGDAGTLEDDQDGASTMSDVDTDTSIEAVADDDTPEEVRRRRKPRARRYKIQEVIKTRQILLVQVVKEERGNKGAALTTYLSLAGRYCVLMPNTARGGGISRKITNAADRKKLKSIASEIEVPQGAGLIIRTAGSRRSKPEIKRDYEYLIRQWDAIRDLTLKSIAPSPIYAEGDLIKRSIRDLYTKEIDEIIVEGESGFGKARDYMKMLMPSHAKNVKHYKDALPLFSRYQVETYLTGMMNPTVQLRSGGYLVIGVTEALVAIDVNSGRSTREGSVEETALKTNLEAAEEVARQLRLRDLAGLIVIDFIDMEERKNNASVEKRLKEHLKNDRARIQVGRISGFGLMEMSRQRLRPGMMEATTAPCPHCHGTGIVRSNDNQSLSILREIEEEAVRQRSKEVLVRVPMEIANYMHNQKREHIAMIEARFGLSIRIEADLQLVSPNFEIERFKTATRIVAQPDEIPGISIEMVESEDIADLEEPEDDTEDEQPKKKKRRRRRRGGRGRNQNAENQTSDASAEDGSGEDASPEGEASDAAEAKPSDTETAEASEEKPKPRRKTTRQRKPKAQPAEDAEAQAEDAKPEPAPAQAEAEKPEATPKSKPEKTAKPEPEVATAAAGDAAEDGEPAKPKRRGWWSLS
ncbi:MAG: Rne/Rng family ribonuclease [Pseudomonadota bacterium]